MALTDAKIRTAKATTKPYKMFDTDGLFIKVTPSGGKLWRFRFRFAGKEKLMAFGEYPRISLLDARQRRDTALRTLDEGRDPSVEKQRDKVQAKNARSLTFELVAREWHEARKNQWVEKYSAQILKRLEVALFSKIGAKPIDSLEPKDVLSALREVEARGVLETTVRLKQYCSSIFRYGIAAGYCRHDPAAPLQDALKTPPKTVHFKSLPRHEVGAFLLRLAASACAPALTPSSEASSLRASRLESISSIFRRSTIEVRQFPPPPFVAAIFSSTASTSTGADGAV